MTLSTTILPKLQSGQYVLYVIGKEHCPFSQDVANEMHFSLPLPRIVVWVRAPKDQMLLKKKFSFPTFPMVFALPSKDALFFIKSPFSSLFLPENDKKLEKLILLGGKSDLVDMFQTSKHLSPVLKK